MTSSRQAMSAYQAGARLASDPRQSLFLLHDGAARALNAAIFAYEQNALDQTCLQVARAHRILCGLLTHLNFDGAGAAGAQLRALYLRLAQRIVCVMSDSDVPGSLRSCADILQILRDGDAKEIQVSTLKSR